jgi:hypothetical protein
LAFEDELEIDEARIAAAAGGPFETVILANRDGIEVDEARLREELGRLAGAEEIASLVVQPSSRVTDVRFLDAFPALETLELYGLRLRTLDGLDAFAHGRYLKVDTGRNAGRDISRLAEAPITRLWLNWARAGDLPAVAASTTLRELTIANCPPLALERWASVPLESMTLAAGEVEELADTAGVPALRRLILDHCRAFTRFAGDNGGLQWMVIQHCDRLDLETVRTCANLEFLTVVGIERPVRLSSFAPLPRLRRLSLLDGTAVVDATALAPDLEELTISGLTADAAAGLSSANPGVVVSDGRVSYVNGDQVAQPR